MVITMLEPQALTTCQHQRIIFVVMGRAVTATIKNGCLIEEALAAVGVRRGLTHSGEEFGKFPRQKLVPLSKWLDSIGLVPVMAELVNVFPKAEKLRELAAQTCGVSHTSDLVCGNTRRISSEGKIDEFVHCPDIVFRNV